MFKASTLYFILFIIVISTIGQICAETYVPALPFLSRDFAVSSGLIQISITVFLLGMSVPGIFFGYISDYFGRRKILIVANSIGLLGTLICLLSPNIYCLILGRFIQGIGFSGVGSLGKAILRDNFVGVQLAKYTSNLAMALVLVVDVSPFIGGILQEMFGWRMIFVFLLAFNSLALFLSYNFNDHKNLVLNKDLHLHKILHATLDILRQKEFMRFNLIVALIYTVLMTYVTVSSFIFQVRLGLSPAGFGATTLTLSLFYLLGAFINGRLLKNHKPQALIQVGTWLMWLATGILFLSTICGYLNYFTMFLSVAIIYLASSSLFSNSSALAFSLIKTDIGSAAAVYTTIPIFSAAVSTYLISYFPATNTYPLVGVMLLSCIGFGYLSHPGRLAEQSPES